MREARGVFELVIKCDAVFEFKGIQIDFGKRRNGDQKKKGPRHHPVHGCHPEHSRLESGLPSSTQLDYA